MTGELKEIVDTVLAVEKRLENRFSTQIKDALIQFERRILSTVNDRISNVEARLIPLEMKVRRIDENVSAMREELDIALSAIDDNSVQLIDHQKRIGRLEKRFV